MNRILLAALFTFHFSLFTSAAEPLRIFIRSGPKSHGPGCHDHPSFLRDWVPLLNERGAKCIGGDEFPTKEQLAQTDVLIIHRDGGGDFTPEQQGLMNVYTEHGGGIVVIHAGSVANTPEGTAYYKQLIGGSWLKGQTKWLEAPMNLYFTDRENPVTKDMSNFAMDDEIYYDMDIDPSVRVLAGAYTPNPKDTKGKGNKEAQARAAEAVQKSKGVNIYDIQPQVWMWERDQAVVEDKVSPTEKIVADVTGRNSLRPKKRPISGAYRAFVCIPGHIYENFNRPNFRALLLRGIAWAGKRDNADELCKPAELGDALRYPEGGPTRPEEAAKKIEVHPEFNISLVASEPLINKVMNVDWDEKGRLWCCETPEYPNGRRELNVEKWKDSGSWTKKLDRDPIDRISWLEDTNGDGVMDKKHVFADKLELCTSFCFYKNGVIASAAPDIWYLEDTDGDGVCDKRTVLYTGLGTGDTHAVINNLRWGLDGWVYATHGYSAGDVTAMGETGVPPVTRTPGVSPGAKTTAGETPAVPATGGTPVLPVHIGSGVVRFKPDGTQIEQYASRGGNTWGLDITWDGQVFFTQPTSGNHFIHVVLPEYVLAKGKLPGVMGTNGMLPREPTYPAMTWPEQAYVQIDQVGSYTAAAGCAIYEGGAWPAKWNYSYFCTEPTLNIVSHFFVEKDGVTYKAHREAGREKTEFIRSTDLWFRPIENRVGPDGALYVVDFYNQAVIHNDTRGPIHGPANAAVRPDRDHYFGRIWKVNHKEAKKVEVPVLDKNSHQSIADSLRFPSAHVKQNALRLLAETDAFSKTNSTKLTNVDLTDFARVATFQHEPPSPKQQLEALPKDQRDQSMKFLVGLIADPTFSPQAAAGAASLCDSAEVRSALVKRFRNSKDDWSRSSVIAAFESHGTTVLNELLNSDELQGTEALVQALLGQAVQRDASNLVASCAVAPSKADALKIIILQGIAQQLNEAPALTPELTAALKKLLAQPALAPAALPLVAKWDKAGALADVVKAQVASLSATLANKSAALPERIGAAKALIQLGGDAGDVGVKALADPSTPDELSREIIAVLDTTGNGAPLVASLSRLKPGLQQSAFDAILKRPEATLALLASIRDGKLNPKDLGPGNIARLRTHPNKQVAKQAATMIDKLSPNAKAKNDIIAQFTPIVEQAGDAAKGKLIFTAACSICHKIGDLGKQVAPPLDGMGAHAPAELLIHILDPNREVDPSFWAWNITKKNGETLAGVISTENTASLTLRNQAGDFEIKKDDIKERINTRISLMPEGLEGLGAENLRDVIAFLASSASGGFRVLDLRTAYNADSRSGIFGSEQAKDDTVSLRKFGNVTVEDVPFFIMDPEKSPNGACIIALKGGPEKSFAQNHPETVEIPVNATAASIHMLGGVAGWAWPFGGDDKIGQPAMTVHVEYADGDKEAIVLKNGEHFADYIGKAEVPLSDSAGDFTRRGQLRYLAINLKKKAQLKKLTLVTSGSIICPCTVAITTSVEPMKQRSADIPLRPNK